jgi:hypothetical protein
LIDAVQLICRSSPSSIQSAEQFGGLPLRSALAIQEDLQWV